MMAIAIASVMAFSSCKEESTEIVDPLAGKHVVEAVIHAEVTGAFTKAIAIEVEYKDFNGKTHTEIVNGKYDGQNATFDASFNTEINGKESEATIHFKGILTDAENYKSEVSPWGIKCSAVATLDGRKGGEFVYNGVTSQSNQPILEDINGTDKKKDNAYLNGFVYLNNRMGDKNLIITVGKTDVTFTNWDL